MKSIVNVTFMGGGKLGQAFLRGLTKNRDNLARPLALHVTDPEPGRLLEIEQISGEIKTHSRLDEEVSRSTDVLVLAMKPNDVDEAVEEIRQAPLRKNSLIVSSVAGLPLSNFEGLGTKSLVRAMPNFGIQIAAGMTVWMASPDTSKDQLAVAKMLFDSVGEDERVKDEETIDLATAVSGSGPAYVLLMMESMIDAATHLGLPRDTARDLVEQTLLGTAEYARISKAHPSVLRSDITSPGGTTAAALHKAERGKLRNVVADMMWGSYRKTREIGGKDTPFGPQV